jgi:hypothetical protein
MEQDHPGVTYEGFNVCQDWLCTWVWCCYFSSRSYDASAYVMALLQPGYEKRNSGIVAKYACTLHLRQVSSFAKNWNWVERSQYKGPRYRMLQPNASHLAASQLLAFFLFALKFGVLVPQTEPACANIKLYSKMFQLRESVITTSSIYSIIVMDDFHRFLSVSSSGRLIFRVRQC